MKVSFDIDGVLANFVSAVVDELRIVYYSDLPIGTEPINWNFGGLCTDEQFKIVFNRLLAQDYFWLNVPDYPENVAALLDYASLHDKDDIHYTTARPECAGGTALSLTRLWLWDRKLPTANVEVVKDPKIKRQHMIDNGIQYSIDDYAPTVLSCQDISGHRAFLLDRPWNQDVDLPRVYSVAEFLMAVEFGGVI